MSKFRNAVASLSVAVIVLAGCGGKAKDLEPQTIPGSADDSIPAPVFPAGSSMERIQKSSKLRVGVPFNQPGFGVKTANDLEPQGFDIEMSKLVAQGIFGGIANDASQHIQYVDTVASNRETFLQNGSVDIVIASYPVTEARKRLVDFAGPYYVSHGDVLLKSDARAVQKLSDLNGRNICAKAGSSLIAALKSKAPQVNIVPAETYGQCTQQLTDGKTEGIISDEVVLAGLMQTSNGATRVLGVPFSDDPYGIGLPKGDDALRAFLNDRIEAIERNGDWAKSYTKTLGQLGLAVPNPPVIDRYVTATTTTSPSSTSSSTTVAGGTSTTTVSSTTSTTAAR